MEKAKVIEADENGNYRPNEDMTRAETAKLVNRILERTPHKDKLLPNMIELPDNLSTSEWYYVEVQESTNSHEFDRVNPNYPETWLKLLPVRDWAALEKEWSNTNSSKNPGNVR